MTFATLWARWHMLPPLGRAALKGVAFAAVVLALGSARLANII